MSDSDYDTAEPDVEAENCMHCGADLEEMQWYPESGVWKCDQCGRVQ